MPESTLRVVAHVRAQPDAARKVRTLLESLVVPTRAEEGSIVYEMLQDLEDPAHFAFVEEWTSDEALAAHMASEHFTSVVERLDGLLAGEPEIGRFRRLR